MITTKSKGNFLRAFMQEVWNEKNFEAVEKYVSPTYQIKLDTADPWEGKTLTHQEFKQRLNFSFGSFPDINFEITSLIEEQDHVAITWVLTGTNNGPIGELPPTNKSIRTTGMTIYHFTNELISGHTQVFDRMTVMKQLGFA